MDAGVQQLKIGNPHFIANYGLAIEQDALNFEATTACTIAGYQVAQSWPLRV